jgi:hypothetical protein
MALHAEKYGDAEYLSPTIDSFGAILQMGTNYEETAWEDRSGDIGYWRGLAVLCLTGFDAGSMTAEEKTAAERFAYLPDGHPHLRLEVDLINDRGSYDADLISGLIQQSEGITGSLVNGVL